MAPHKDFCQENEEVSMELLQPTCKSSNGQDPWSSQTTVRVSWLHPATKSANVCCITELCLQWAGSVEQSARNTVIQSLCTFEWRLQMSLFAAANVLICSMMNITRRCCGVLRVWHRCIKLDLLTLKYLAPVN